MFAFRFRLQFQNINIMKIIIEGNVKPVIMVAETILKTCKNHEKFLFDEESKEKLCDFEDDDCFVNQLEKQCEKNGNSNYERRFNEYNENKKPKSILINHENENVTKKTKPNRFVSFTLDENKKPFTSSIYYGVKSYLHHFYEPVNKTAYDTENLMEDDFEFVVEPGRRRRSCWFLISVMTGIVFLLIGIVIILAANLTPLRNPVVGIKHNLEILDQKAIAFNQKIETCQFLGLIIFCAGGIIIMLTLLVATYEQECGCNNIRNQILYPSLMDSNAWIRYVEGYPNACDSRIPLSEEIKAVQIDRIKD